MTRLRLTPGLRRGLAVLLTVMLISIGMTAYFTRRPVETAAPPETAPAVTVTIPADTVTKKPPRKSRRKSSAKRPKRPAPVPRSPLDEPVSK